MRMPTRSARIVTPVATRLLRFSRFETPPIPVHARRGKRGGRGERDGLGCRGGERDRGGACRCE